MKLLITGALGQLGTALQKTLSNHELVLVDLPEHDISDKTTVWALMANHQPELVVNCAAYTNVEGCAKDPDLAYKANGLGAQNLAIACHEFGTTLLHVSTNEVFAGIKPQGYNEWDTLDPINPYGNSKAAGEFYVRNHCPNHYIVRTAWLYAPGGRNFIHAILNRAKAHGAIRVVTDEIGNPTYVNDLAEAIGKLILTGQFGTYHFVNAGICSRHEFANEILRLAGLSDVTNEPILSSEFTRLSSPPPFGGLVNNAGKAIGIELRPWQTALADYLTMEIT
jgi:dTDP-4-dehydrorhamnose reductase